MRSGWTTVIIVILSVFVLLVAMGQLFFAGGDRLTTETAYVYNFEDEVPFYGVYLRDESLIYNSGMGILNYEQENGSKVGKSSVVARRYKSDSDAVYLREIKSLEKQIDVLNNAEKLVGTDNSQLEAISIQINESHSDIISAIQNGDFATAVGKESSLLEAMCKREITLSDSHQGYAEKKLSLQSEINRLNMLISGGVQDIVAGSAGYFVSGVDGYESELSFSSSETITESKINEIVENPNKSGSTQAIGKLIADYHWRVAAVIETEKMFGIYEGDELTLRVGSGGETINVEVISINSCGEDKSIYVFECDELNSTVASGRTALFKLIVNSYGGLRVPRKAIKYSGENDEDRGVFIERGQTLVFKKINVVYWGDDYVICSQEPGDDYLKLYDKIVTEGKDLYDGKIIK